VKKEKNLKIFFVEENQTTTQFLCAILKRKILRLLILLSAQATKKNLKAFLVMDNLATAQFSCSSRRGE
jgi:hypothetical protein